MSLEIIIGIIIVVVILIALVAWHSKKTTYKCPKCSKKFKISFLTDLISPHWIWCGSYKYLKCPNCKNRVKAKEVKK
jgi:DNA-directed RNA polymerase subunit RPC12/RpoP